MKRGNIVAVIVAVALLSGCKIQNAPGAYLPAKGKIEVESMEPEQIVEEQPVVPMPVPTPIVVEPEKPEPEPVYVEEPEPVTEVPVVVPAPVEEPENTRAEKFTVVDAAEEKVLKGYHLVIGSFGQKTNAQNLQQQMRPEYDPVIVINERGLYRVILISYDTYAETRKKIESLRDQFPDAWVLIQKK